VVLLPRLVSGVGWRHLQNTSGQITVVVSGRWELVAFVRVCQAVPQGTATALRKSWCTSHYMGHSFRRTASV